MEKTFVEIVVKIQVNEEVRLDLGNVELVASRSRTITRTIFAKIDHTRMVVLITENYLKLIGLFDTLKFKVVESGFVGENENGSLKVEMHYREL